MLRTLRGRLLKRRKVDAVESRQSVRIATESTSIHPSIRERVERLIQLGKAQVDLRPLSLLKESALVKWEREKTMRVIVVEALIRRVRQ